MKIKALVLGIALATGTAMSVGAAEPVFLEVKSPEVREEQGDLVNGASEPVVQVVTEIATKARVRAVTESTAKVTADDIRSTMITVYPGHGLVNQTIAEKLAVGNTEVQVQPDPRFWQMDTLMLSAGDSITGVLPISQSWLAPLVETSELVSALVGNDVELVRPDESPVIGQLQAWNGTTGLLLLRDGRQELFHWMEGFSLRSVGGNLLSVEQLMPELRARFSLSAPVDTLNLSYFNQGLRFSNQYRLILNPEKSQLTLSLGATVNNSSLTNYKQAAITLAAGDSGESFPPNYQLKRAMSVAMDESAGMAGGSRSGELLFMPVPGLYDLPARSSVSLYLDSERELTYQSNYSYSFYGSAHKGNEVVSGHPEATIRFVPSRDLPAGPVQVFTSNKDVPLRMVHRGQLAQTAGDNPADLNIGEAYTVTVERSRLEVQQTRDGWEVDWQLKATNSLDKPVRLVIDDSSYQLLNISKLSGIKRDGVELYAEIPAGTTKTLLFTSLYSKK